MIASPLTWAMLGHNLLVPEVASPPLSVSARLLLCGRSMNAPFIVSRVQRAPRIVEQTSRMASLFSLT